MRMWNKIVTFSMQDSLWWICVSLWNVLKRWAHLRKDLYVPAWSKRHRTDVLGSALGSAQTHDICGVSVSLPLCLSFPTHLTYLVIIKTEWNGLTKNSIKIAYTWIGQILSNFTPVSPYQPISFCQFQLIRCWNCWQHVNVSAASCLST